MSLPEELRNGNELAWEHAFKSLYGVAYQAAWTRLGDNYPSECEDVAIESLTALANRHFAESDENALRAQVAAFALNKATSRYRSLSAAKRGRNQVVSLEALGEESTQATVGTTGAEFLDHLTANELREVLQQLSQSVKKEHRMLLHDYYLHGMSYGEIGAKYDVSTNFVGVCLHRALDTIRAALASKPALCSELSDLAGAEAFVKLVLPVLSLIQLTQWFVEARVVYSEESVIYSPSSSQNEAQTAMLRNSFAELSARNLKEPKSPKPGETLGESILRAFSEEPPEVAIIDPAQLCSMIELARIKRPDQFERWREQQNRMKDADSQRKQSAISDRKSGCFTVMTFLIVVLALGIIFSMVRL